MCLDGGVADHQLRRDLRVAAPARDRAEHLELPISEVGQIVVDARRRRGPAELLDQPAGGARGEQGLTGELAKKAFFELMNPKDPTGEDLSNLQKEQAKKQGQDDTKK